MELREFDGARQDLLEASKLDPTSKEVRSLFATCKEREAVARKGSDDKQRAVYAKMF